MATINLLMNTLAVAAPYDPPPAGYARVGTVLGATNATYWTSAGGGQQACWAYSTDLAGDVVSVEMASPLYGSGTGNGQGVFLYNSISGIGVQLFSANTTTLSLQVFTNGVMTTATSLHTITVAAMSGAYSFGLRYTKSLSQIQITLNGVDVGVPYATTISNVRGGCSAFSTNFNRGVSRLTVVHTPSYSVDTFNAGNDIERGQQNVDYTTSGFSSITTITSNISGVNVTGVNDTLGDGNADVSDYVEAGLYPLLPSSVIYTFGDGTNTATITKALIKKSTDTALLSLGLITVNDSFFGYHMLAAGRSVADGCQMVFPTTPGFTLNNDGSFNYIPVGSETEVTVPIWYRDVADGRSYEFITTFTYDGTILTPVSGSYKFTIGIGIGIGI